MTLQREGSSELVARRTVADTVRHRLEELPVQLPVSAPKSDVQDAIPCASATL
jgi:hypothetical protein